jgi:coenzyme Q-binding protein COQ10
MCGPTLNFCHGVWPHVSAKNRRMIWTADLIIGFNMFRERFTSYVQLDPDTLEINVAYAEGPFKYLRNQWVFHPHPDGCEIEFYVDFEFNSRLLQSVIETLFTEAVKRMVRAFESRADALYKTTS